MVLPLLVSPLTCLRILSQELLSSGDSIVIHTSCRFFPFLVSLKLVPGFYLKDLSDGDSTVIHTSCRLSHSPSSLVFKCILFCIFCVSLFSNILQITLTNYPLQNVSFYTAELHSRAGTHTYCISVCMCKISG